MNNREEWGSRWGFILATVGSAVGLGNIWRFPYQVYANHSGVFLLVYFFALFTAGIPILILEFSLANKFKGAAPSVFARISPQLKVKSKWEWLGWFQTFIAFFISTYYIVIVGWSLGYFALSFNKTWGADTGTFFTQFLGNDSVAMAAGNIDFLHYTPWIPILSLVAWIFLYIILRSGVKKGIEKSSKFFMPLLVLMLAIITIRSVCLPGASAGLNELFYPDFKGLTLKEFFDVAIAAYGQIFYSLSVCFSIMIAYASYLPKKSDITNNAMITGLLDCGFSIVSAVMIFSIIGNMAHQQGTEISALKNLAGAGLTFITIPQALNSFPGIWGQIIGVLFFLSLTFAGITSAISILEAVIAAIVDKFNIPRKKVVLGVTLIGFPLSVLFSSTIGSDALTVSDNFLSLIGILGSGILEIFLLAWLFDLKQLKDHVNQHSDFKVGKFWVFCTKYFTPIVLLALIPTNIISLLAANKITDWKLTLVFGWILVATLLLLGILFSFLKGHKSHLESELQEELVEAEEAAEEQQKISSNDHPKKENAFAQFLKKLSIKKSKKNLKEEQ